MKKPSKKTVIRILVAWVLIGIPVACVQGISESSDKARQETTTTEAAKEEKAEATEKEAETKKDEEKAAKKSQDKKKSSNKEAEKGQAEEAKPIVDRETYYDVFRVDKKDGVMADVEVVTQNTTDFGDWYAVLDEEGHFNFEIDGVTYNGILTLGGPAKHRYSGMRNADVTRLLFDGKETATVGSVDIEGYTVDGYLLVEMVTTVDKKFCDYTFYLWEHHDE